MWIFIDVVIKLLDILSEVESKTAKGKTQTKEITISFDIPWNKKIGKVKQKITLAMSPTSVGLFDIGKDIEKYSGLSKSEAEEYKETPTDSYIYGLVNNMNGANDIFFWTNGNRLAGDAKEKGIWAAIGGHLSHECCHLARNIIAKHLMGDGYPVAEWPSIGEQKNDSIEEEALTTALGRVVEQITDSFLEMAETYIPALTKKVRELK